MNKNILIVGSSRGIGAELAKYFSQAGHNVIGISRSKSVNCEWIEGDISSSEGIAAICWKIGDRAIDTLIFSAGVWEDRGFMPDFSFLKTTDRETRHIMTINVVAPIELTKQLVDNLAQSSNPRAIYLGAMSGLDNLASDQVAYSASKFALRGAIQGLRKAVKEKGVGFTVINLGNVATEEVLADMEQGLISQQQPIPVSDIVSSVEWLMALTHTVEVADLNLAQK